ncbi:MAG: DUF3450 domain-containing protein [Verrucomicrobia bacterium]|nr:DUF3450 domain-containing protein [Verrucomicrobiota bacterium]
MNRRWICWLSLAAIVGMPLQAAETRLSEVRTALEKWVETRQLIGKTESDWKVNGETLRQTIQLLEQERASIREQMTTVSTNSVTVAKERVEAEISKKELTLGLDSVRELVSGFEARLRELSAAFPPPLLERIQPVLQRIPADSAQTKLSASERVQTVVTLLNEIDKFNGAITVASQVQKNPSGAEVQVDTLYLGLGQAYFVDKSGDYAGVGIPTVRGWDWEARPGLASKINQALAIYRNTRPAEFLSLPAQIR